MKGQRYTGDWYNVTICKQCERERFWHKACPYCGCGETVTNVGRAVYEELGIVRKLFSDCDSRVSWEWRDK